MAATAPTVARTGSDGEVRGTRETFVLVMILWKLWMSEAQASFAAYLRRCVLSAYDANVATGGLSGMSNG